MNGRQVCRTLESTWSWISPDEVLTAALVAVFAARKAVRNPAGEPWILDGGSWSDREDFGNELVRAFAAAIERHAAAAGLHEAWLMDGGFVLPSGCRGGAPAVMGQGWPASAEPAQPVPSAVGPARAELPVADITLPADPLFCAREVQELPWNIQRGETHNGREERQC